MKINNIKVSEILVTDGIYGGACLLEEYENATKFKLEFESQEEFEILFNLMSKFKEAYEQ